MAVLLVVIVLSIIGKGYRQLLTDASQT